MTADGSGGLAALIARILAAALPVIVAITLHEAAHGYAASALGDPTARLAGRLSLNPLRHVDRVGTILLPGFLLISQLLTIGRVEFMFGWAKPVPVDARAFRHPRRGMALVAAAGPAMNGLLAWLGALSLHLEPHLPGAWVGAFDGAVIVFMVTNVVLGLFNLLPIPPLDGGRIAVGLLPLKLALQWARLERFGFAIVLGLVFLLPRLTRGMPHAIDPVGQALHRLVPACVDLLLRLGGVDGAV